MEETSCLKMENKKPTVSVVLTAYNGEKFIREQLDSIVAQTYPVHELLIQDDCSTDDTINICREYESKYPYIHLFLNDHNLGYKENFRTVTMRATGDFIALSDQDDVWFPNKIERQVEAIGDHDVCYSQHLRGTDMEHAHVVSYKNAPERQMFAAIVGHSLFMTREFAQDNNNWLGYLAHDIGLSVLGHFRRGVVCVDEPLNWHRSFDESVSTKAHLDMFNDKNEHPTWQPYVYGAINYFRLQKKETWQKFYTRLLEESDQGKNPLVHQLCQLLLSKNPFALLHLCLLCMKHRATIYPGNNTQGLMGKVRGFCFPFIHSYHCTFYDS